ncbi:MAG: PhzF family phenazine biosynthesis protein [Candidatus Rokuibacteriota bacterium]|nr:MAG: PhzF family phenazine biosynthesis protein [Candidatus Rokubacteria bacterium]
MPSPRSYRYRVVDVFTTQPLEGNPLAVFPEASGLDDVTMQKIAREMNLSETVFVVPATRASFSAGVRIFTPTRELPFAGHPTVGTSFVLLDEGTVPAGTKQFVLEEKVGPVPVRVETGERPLIWLTTPPISYGRTYDRLRCAQALGIAAHDLLDITPQWLSAGNPTVFIALRDRRAVDDAWLDSHGVSIIKGADAAPICVFVFTPAPEGAYARMFAPEYGVPEDPATGSSTGPLAAFMIRHRLVSGAAGTRFVSEQGTKMGRRSILYVELHGEGGADGIDVGGYVTPIAEGTLKL